MPLSTCANVPNVVSLAEKFNNSEDPMFKKFSPFGTCCLCLSSPFTKIAPCPLWWASAHKVWVVAVLWFGLQPYLNKKRCKFCERAQHVQCASQVNFLYVVVMPLSRWANVPTLVSLAQKFTKSEDPMLKKFSLSGTC